MALIDALLNKYILVKTQSSGCFAGYLKAKEDNEVILTNCRRLWSWTGADSETDLATNGTSLPHLCSFSAPIAEIYLTNVIEIIPITEVAQASIQSVSNWSAQSNG